ncbi:hypothetical protein APS56_15445 [Pseudalgibacter alginicilyticus]|uniref:Threonine synthase n=1 Tax=Pseudalgibacter alginicilyticus TaxID=1736674 RepID=A0A0P0D0H9_9FLAO|nr:DUF6503 family protein [Pseudalgibacter alginicilyticus]ALJ06442.1 hypothetical protein APS56_15445 [Pseudalgibacter alginicilyticus]
MKKIILLTLAISIFACKNKTTTTVVTEEENISIAPNRYPENLIKIFDAHGGLDTWKSMKSLEFTMPKESGNEITTTNLQSRKSLIETPSHALGYNGKDVWLLNKEDKPYKGKPKFYYNLMFYFYAMPFILADDGINYKEAEPLVFEGKTYPGIGISYDAGIGESPEDEYVLYYNPETFKMAWLGYTVTFFTNEKAKELHFRRYSDWQDVNGLLLPKTMVSYNYENNLPTTARGENEFINVKVSKEKPEDALFDIPEEGAEVIE